MSAPLHGLLLAGGKSRRMGTDKAELVVQDGLTLRERGIQLLQTVTHDVHLSIAADDTTTYSVPTLTDRRANAGPLAGLDAAFARAPDAAWLVLACDLPFLTEDILTELVNARDPEAGATCFLSRFDSKPEPLCTIYEPSAAANLQNLLDEDVRCARKFLFSLERKELELPEAAALDNCNRPEDLAEARLQISGGRITKTVTVEYCGPLREEAGQLSEEVETDSATAAGLWEELRMQRSFSLDLDALKLAVNDEFQPWTHPLQDGDRLAFFPPFAGG